MLVEDELLRLKARTVGQDGQLSLVSKRGRGDGWEGASESNLTRHMTFSKVGYY